MKKWIKSLSLVMSGVVLGVGISFAGDISAATSKLLGNKVGKVMTVTLNNKNIGEAPVIEGTSYVPVRTAANSLGLGVTVEGNEIKLSSSEDVLSNEEMAALAKQQQEEAEKAAAMQNKKNEEKKKVEDAIETAKRKITNADNSIANSSTLLEYAKAGKAAGAVGMDPIIKAHEEDIESAKSFKEQQKKELANLEAQLAALK
ncbi:hypothetical protein NKT34_13560 [Paenibacillus polysaccharolyticus]|uniref:hypothetical protein n=1 Tax=Paenibacillus polysaccharolyticus TaxID=582692 RepID=UPI00209D4B8D|nr:hypothetical protein [Paenibacillus polysaccharolyticus]MCP1134326.1 hypothetical protein [Paenibacillus polysaccharolyticus]